MIKYLLLFITVIISFNAEAQHGGKYGRRVFISANLGLAFTGNPIYRYQKEFDITNIYNPSVNRVYYDPKTGKQIDKRNGVHLPIELGVNFAISKNNVIKIQYGSYKAYSELVESISKDQNKILPRQPGIFHPFISNELTVGFQITNPFYIERGFFSIKKNKNYVAPINRSYFELEYVHSFYTLISEYVNDQPSIQASVITLGFYRNFYMKKSKNTMLFAGLRTGIPVYSNKKHVNYIPQNTESNRDLIESWNNIIKTNTVNKAFQFKMGIKYIL